MSSEIVACVGCGFKAIITTEQFCGHVYCQDCILNAELIGQPVCSLVHSWEEQLEGSTKFDGYVCCYCNSPLDIDDRQSHFEVCEFYPINCPLNCEKKCLRSQVEIHLQECSRKLHQCSFLPLGCSFQGSRAEIENHDNDKIHLKLITNSLINLENEISSIKSQTARSFNDVTELEDKVKNLECADNENKIKMADVAAMHKNQKLQNVISVIIIAVVIGISIHNLKAERQHQQDAEIELINDKYAKLKEQDAEIDIINDKLSEQIENVKLIAVKRIEDTMVCDSDPDYFCYIWKIENYTQQQENIEVYSDSFYNKEFGYKMRLVMYPNGINGEKTHLSVSLQFLIGSYDKILVWPNECSGKFTLLNKFKSREDHTVDFWGVLRKPEAHLVTKELNEFISLSNLDHDYLFFDSIFLKVEIRIGFY